MARTSRIERSTAETRIVLTLDLDGTGKTEIQTGVGFLDHMLTLFAKHGLFDLTVSCEGDTHIDDHHSVEDIGICLGQAIREAVGNKAGIVRYGDKTLPMEDALVTVGLDLSGRVWFVDQSRFPTEKIGTFDTQLIREFWQSVASNVPMNLHFVMHHGQNSHHIAEALFKATARALREAVTIDPRQPGVPSSKGVL